MEINRLEAAQWGFAIVGEVDADNCERLLEEIDAANPEADELVLDLSGLTFLDSSGISALLQIRSELQNAGARLQLVSPTESVHRVLEITGLLSTFGLTT